MVDIRPEYRQPVPIQHPNPTSALQPPPLPARKSTPSPSLINPSHQATATSRMSEGSGPQNGQAEEIVPGLPRPLIINTGMGSGLQQGRLDNPPRLPPRNGDGINTRSDTDAADTIGGAIQAADPVEVIRDDPLPGPSQPLRGLAKPRAPSNMSDSSGTTPTAARPSRSIPDPLPLVLEPIPREIVQISGTSEGAPQGDGEGMPSIPPPTPHSPAPGVRSLASGSKGRTEGHGEAPASAPPLPTRFSQRQRASETSPAPALPPRAPSRTASPSPPSRFEDSQTNASSTYEPPQSSKPTPHHRAPNRVKHIPSNIPQHLPNPLNYPSPALIALLSLPMLLSYLRANILVILGSCVGVWFLWADWKTRERRRYGFGPEVDKERTRGVGRKGMEESGSDETVEWMNHVLASLWPMLNTDLLVPVIDLVEDALLQQVPPIVSSVRLTSPSLGEEPIHVDAIRWMSDEEWFENLSSAPSAPESSSCKKIMEKMHLLKPKDQVGHGRSVSEGGQSKVDHKSDPSRTSSADQKHRNMEVSERRRRDRILRRIGGRRGQGVGGPEGDRLAEDTEKNGADGTIPTSEGTTVKGDDEDPGHIGDGGQYVNLAIDFSYDGRKNRTLGQKGGWDLHFLGYFGIGLKGVGGGEFPVWIEMLKLTGTMHVRLLLCPDIPFVRTATLSLPELPSFDFTAKPLRRDLGLDAMSLPLIKPFIDKSILDVANAFLRPNSYSLDVDRLLMGEESALRTEAIGVLHLRIHSARGLKASDTFGSSDPYATVAFAKYGKPSFSTRTIVDSLEPRWEEDTYLLIPAEAIESGDRIQITIFDADRFSVDDALGMVECDVADLLDSGDKQQKGSMKEEISKLAPIKEGLPSQGELLWSFAFYPIWKMPQDAEQKNRLADAEWNKDKHGPDDVGTSLEGKALQSNLLYKMMSKLRPEPYPWEAERRKRRLESIAWLTGERARETLEASLAPSMSRRSGILQFGVLQCMDLELQQTAGTFKSQSRRQSSAAGGKPAIGDIVDSMAWESDKPPSPYAEVILNGRLVYRTRTKQLSPAPYWNAVGERFIRDWTKARLVVVVRDERDREHDPILGLAVLDLTDIFNNSSQKTRNYPLVGGIGWGIVRISLLFKSIDVQLPQGISGYEVATIRLDEIDGKRPPGWTTDNLALRVQSDVAQLDIPYNDGLGLKRSSSRMSFSSRRSSISGKSVRNSIPGEDFRPESLKWKLPDSTKHRFLAVEYRHCCFLTFQFVQETGKLKKDVTLGLAVVRLSHVKDNSTFEAEIPIYDTADINAAVGWALDREAALQRGESDPHAHLALIRVKFKLISGLSRVHGKLARRDKRFLHVYQAWQAAKDIGMLSDYKVAHSREQQVQNLAKPDDIPGDEGNISDDEDIHSGLYSQSSANSSVTSAINDAEEADEEVTKDLDAYGKPTSALGKFMDHQRALGRQQKGIMQSKLMRNLKFGKDKIVEKATGGKAVANRTHRPHGADIDVELEGISKL